MGILQSLKNALSSLFGRPGLRDPANNASLAVAREEHKAFKDETARLAKATEAFERERKLAVERKSNMVEAADTIAGRKKLREVEALNDKAEMLSSDGTKPARKKAAPKPAKSALKPVKTKPKVQKKS